MKAYAVAAVALLIATPVFAKTYKVKPGPQAQAEFAGAFAALKAGDRIALEKGRYELVAGLSATVNKFSLRGEGPDKTVLSFTGQTAPGPCLSLSGADIVQLQELVRRVPVSDQVLGYAWALVRATRPGTPEAADFVEKWVSWGAGPRGLLTLITCAKARAILHGRYHATQGGANRVAGGLERHAGAAPFGRGIFGGDHADTG